MRKSHLHVNIGWAWRPHTSIFSKVQILPHILLLYHTFTLAAGKSYLYWTNKQQPQQPLNVDALRAIAPCVLPLVFRPLPSYREMGGGAIGSQFVCVCVCVHCKGDGTLLLYCARRMPPTGSRNGFWIAWDIRTSRVPAAFAILLRLHSCT